MKKVRAGAHTWALLIVVFLAVGVGSASSSSGLPHIKIGKHVCTSSLSRWGNCGAVVVASSSGTPLAGTTPPAAALGPVAVPLGVQPSDHRAGRARRSRSSTPTTIRTSRPTWRQRQYYGLPAVHHGQRLLPQGERNGRHHLPADGRRLVARDRPRRRDGTRDLPELQDPARRGPDARQTPDLGAAENEAVALGANVISNSWLSRRVLERDRGRDGVLPPPGRRDHRVDGRQRLRRRVPGGVALRHGRRRHDPHAQLERRVPQRVRLERHRLRLFEVASRSPPGRPTPAARGEPTPTCRPTPIRTPAPRSSTRFRTADRPAGSRSAARASRRRSSQGHMRSQDTRAPSTTPPGSTRTRARCTT